AAEMASRGLDPDRLTLYFDLIMTSLSGAARRELQTMDRAKYQYQSDFAKRYVAEGKAEGRLEGQADGQRAGKASLVVRLLTLRFGPLSDDVQTCISQSSVVELDAIGERLLTAASAEDALNLH
ncbi:MAG: DUF4351 domain-containing protein, partial [Steroidobacteraceae bacterium]